LFNKALQYRDTHITEVNSFDEFKDVLENKQDLFQRIGMVLQKQKKK
jgi:hypothetical protein